MARGLGGASFISGVRNVEVRGTHIGLAFSILRYIVNRCAGRSSVISGRKLLREEIEQVWNIDRSEVIDNIYRFESGTLVLSPHHFDVPGRPPGEATARALAFRDSVQNSHHAGGRSRVGSSDRARRPPEDRLVRLSSHLSSRGIGSLFELVPLNLQIVSSATL